MSGAAKGPNVLVTGFGPFPGAPENPTDLLMRVLAAVDAGALGASSLQARVLPTEYRRSWSILRRVYSAYRPDVVVHFGLAKRAERIILERVGRKRVEPGNPDAVGYAPPSGLARRSGPDEYAARLPVHAILTALTEAGLPASISEDAGAYVCNATLYRSLHASAAAPQRWVGFVHVPPRGVGGFTPDRLEAASRMILATAVTSWRSQSVPGAPGQLARVDKRAAETGSLPAEPIATS